MSIKLVRDEEIAKYKRQIALLREALEAVETVVDVDEPICPWCERPATLDEKGWGNNIVEMNHAPDCLRQRVLRETE